jgi:CDP-paratose 2-epimerase
MQRGDGVVLVDDLSRRGTEKNLEWLRGEGSFTFHKVDIREAEPVAKLLAEHADADLILHLAGQVAVTLSVQDPRDDFEVNALGTFNVLEGARRAEIRAPILFSSTNKVYGGMEEVGVVERNGRYAYRDLPEGVSEEQNLDFHSPYGCSKGAADQYVRDYHRIFGLRTVVLRQSCIYGYRQFGAEDQGWVAWFTIASQLGRPITVYGDGKQIRDVLWIDDLLDAFDAAAGRIGVTAGQVYNVGGGPDNTLSLRELLTYLGERQGSEVPFVSEEWRPGDQKVFVSDIRRAGRDLQWTPKVSREQGLDLLYDWVAENKPLFD